MKKIYSLLAILATFIFSKAQNNLCVTDIVFNYYTGTIFTTDGKAYTWGQNPYGQVGNGTTLQQNTLWQRPLSPKFVQLFHSLDHAAAVSDAGKAYTWGRNSRGGLGDGTTLDKLTPVQIGSATDWKKITTGNFHTVALKTNGTLWGWGNNSACELTDAQAAPFPNNFYTTPLHINPDSDWAEIATGGARTFAIKNNGTLWGRGRNNDYALGVSLYGNEACVNLTQIGNATDWKRVSTSVSGNFTLGLKTNNTLWGWGNNISGAVGNGISQLVQTPVQIGTATWLDVSAGHPLAAGIRSDGTLWWWGQTGCLGPNGPVTPNSLSPVQLGTATNWVKVSAGNCGIYAVRNDNTLWAFGAWLNPQNNGTLATSLTPVLILQCTLSTSENEKELSNIILYPNPTVDRISWAQNIPIEKVTIYDMSSRKVLAQKVSGSSVDVSHLSAGTYMITLEKNDKTFYNSKFIKK